MKRLFLLSAVFCVITASAQNYQISFTGTGASTTVATVKVENLTSATSLNLNGSDILRLTALTDINTIENIESSQVKIYPNPMTDKSIVQIYPPAKGSAVISVLDMSGKVVAQIESDLENYLQEFRLSGINSGFYLINVKGGSYRLSGKLLSNSTNTGGRASIEKLSNNQAVQEQPSKKSDSKGAQAIIDMTYTTGDRLKFTGTSGNFSTVVIDIPVATKTVNFDFVACTDGDNINYPVVKIGTQVWMAANLKTTKYLNGNVIGTTTADITAEVSPKYQWAYNDNDLNVPTYGRLYTWYTITDARGACPTGWHVPSDTEWQTLADYLNNNGYAYSGIGSEDIAKSMASTTGWSTFTTPGTIGHDPKSNNSSGFSAVPGGYRNANTTYTDIGADGHWRSATASTPGNSWYRSLDYNFGTFYRNDYGSNGGYSVRCIK